MPGKAEEESDSGVLSATTTTQPVRARVPRSRSSFDTILLGSVPLHRVLIDVEIPAESGNALFTAVG